jgi:8-oxo-dGTP pyrophosphatase MutT (NUDIX family)
MGVLYAPNPKNNPINSAYCNPMTRPNKEAAFAIIIEEGKVLLTLRRDVPIWVLPGGGIDPGETPEAACLREVHEETGLQGVILRKTHELTPVNALAEPTHLYWVKSNGELIPSSPESKANAFFSLDALPKNLFWPHALWVQEALDTKETLKRSLNEISWKNLLLFILRHPIHFLRFLGTRMKLMIRSSFPRSP